MFDKCRTPNSKIYVKHDTFKTLCGNWLDVCGHGAGGHISEFRISCFCHWSKARKVLLYLVNPFNICSVT